MFINNRTNKRKKIPTQNILLLFSTKSQGNSQEDKYTRKEKEVSPNYKKAKN